MLFERMKYMERTVYEVEACCFHSLELYLTSLAKQKQHYKLDVVYETVLSFK